MGPCTLPDEPAFGSVAAWFLILSVLILLPDGYVCSPFCCWTVLLFYPEDIADVDGHAKIVAHTLKSLTMEVQTVPSMPTDHIVTSLIGVQLHL